MNWLVPLLFGTAFGITLERAELTRRERVVGAFRFADLTMLKFLLAALVTGAFVVQAALSLGLVASVPVPPTAPLANLVGGILFGGAMAGAGFCSGTIFAASGSGRGGVLAGLLGLLAGALVMEGVGGEVAAKLRSAGPRFDATISAVTEVNAWLIVLGLAAATAFIAYVAERRRPGGGSAGPRSQRSAWSTSR